VWLSDIDGPVGLAVSSTLLVVSQVTAVTTRVLVYDLGGSLVTSFGGDALEDGDPCCIGTRLGLPSSLAVGYGHPHVCFAQSALSRTDMHVFRVLATLPLRCRSPPGAPQ
jgi:hypothetical protein